jgi:hypothetical protein
MFDDLPIALRGEIVAQLAGIALRGARVFRDVPFEVSRDGRPAPLSKMAFKLSTDPRCVYGAHPSPHPRQRSPTSGRVPLLTGPRYCPCCAPPAAAVLQIRARLAASAEPLRLVAGHSLYEEGDEAHMFYVLQAGEWAVVASVRAPQCPLWPQLRSSQPARRAAGGGFPGGKLASPDSKSSGTKQRPACLSQPAVSCKAD